MLLTLADTTHKIPNLLGGCIVQNIQTSAHNTLQMWTITLPYLGQRTVKEYCYRKTEFMQLQVKRK